MRRKTLTKVRVDSAVESWYTDNGPTGGHHCPTIERRAAIRESGALLFSFALLPESCVQEGAPCAGGAPRPRNPLPPSLIGGWARKVKKRWRGPPCGALPALLRRSWPPPQPLALRRRFGGHATPRPRLMLPQAPAGQRCGRLRRPSKRQGQALRALRGLAFSPARLRPGLSPRMCSGAQSGPVGWWPCCAPSAPNGPPGFAPPAGGPSGAAARQFKRRPRRSARPAWRGRASSGRDWRAAEGAERAATRPQASRPFARGSPHCAARPGVKGQAGQPGPPLTPAAERRKAPFA